MLKFIVGISLVVFGSFCGYFLARTYRKRRLFFAQFQEFNERFLTEISYSKRPLADFFAGFQYDGSFACLLTDFYNSIESWGENGRDVLNMPDYDFITKQEKTMLFDYFLMLGKGDTISQKGYFSTLKLELSKLQNETEIANKRYGDLYVKIGFLCGLLILILIV